MKFLREAMSIIIPIAIGLAIAFLIRQFVFQMVRVDGPSMEPNLSNNERVIVSKTSPIKHLSVIVFDAHGEDPQATQPTDYVKRVIGLPGDTVESKNGYIYVNHKKINQSFISASERTSGTGNWTLASLSKRNGWGDQSTVVPKGEYFVLGDHRSVSNDSRYWGFVPKKKVLGVVKVPFWNQDAKHKHNINSLSY